MSDNANSSGPTSIGEAMYGRDGPIGGGPGDARVRELIESGIAKPAAPPVSRPPPAAEPRTAAPSARQGEPPAGEKTLGEAFYGKPEAAAGQPFDAAKIAMPEGMTADPALMGEFGEAAKALGIDKAGGDRLVALHTRAVEQMHDQHNRTADKWRSETEAAFTPDELVDLRDDFNRAIGDDADAKEFKRLLSWSGIGNHPAAVRVIQRMLGRRGW